MRSLLLLVIFSLTMENQEQPSIEMSLLEPTEKRIQTHFQVDVNTSQKNSSEIQLELDGDSDEISDSGNGEVALEPIKQEISISHSRDSQASNHFVYGKKATSSSNFSGQSMGGNFWQRWYYVLRERTVSTYYKYVTFKKECILMLLFLLPFGLVVGFVQSLTTLTIKDENWSIAFKVILILIGMIAERSVSIINSRHSELTAMIDILSHHATPDCILRASQGKRENKSVKIVALIFNILLIATEMTMEPIPILTSFGAARRTRTSADPSKVLLENNTQIFEFAIGTKYTCHSCIGFRTDNTFVVPMAGRVKELLHAQTETTHFYMSEVQDVIGINAHCYSILNPSTPPNDYQSFLYIHSIIWGLNQTTVVLDVTSKSGSFVDGKHCRISFTDRRAIIDIDFNLHGASNLKLNRVLDIRPSDPSSCIKFDGRCLNYPKRSDFSYSLIKASLQQSYYQIDKITSFPDPMLTPDASDYEYEIENFMSMLLLNAIAQFVDPLTITEVFTDDQLMKMNVVHQLNYALITLSCLCVLMSVLQIFLDLVQLGRTPDSLLRKLHEVIQPGKEHLKSLAFLANIRPNDDWTIQYINYGEDRTTVGEEKGFLRFGARKEIVRYKADRVYQ